MLKNKLSEVTLLNSNKIIVWNTGFEYYMELTDRNIELETIMLTLHSPLCESFQVNKNKRNKKGPPQNYKYYLLTIFLALIIFST